jgi:hypothetical protein
MSEGGPLPQAIEMSWRDRCMFLRGRADVLTEALAAATEFGKPDETWRGFMARMAEIKEDIAAEEALLKAEVPD